MPAAQRVNRQRVSWPEPGRATSALLEEPEQGIIEGAKVGGIGQPSYLHEAFGSWLASW